MAATLARLVVVLALAAAAAAHLQRPKGLRETRPEMWMNTVELGSRYGHTVDTHKFTTSDGYELVLHRVHNPNTTRPGPPVHLGHGMSSCDEQWVIRGPQGIVFMLVDRGFDVWMVNYRGSFYSRKHKTLTVNDHDFWDFSWHENGVIDQAESIDYVLNYTGEKQVFSIGHSMSSTAQVVLMAERPEYAAKLKGTVLVAPPVFFKHTTGAMATVAAAMTGFPTFKAATSQYVENNKFFGFNQPFPQYCYKNYGGFKPKIFPICRTLIEFALGKFHEPLSDYYLQLVMHHYPAGTAIRQALHYAQCTNAGKLAKYDFGAEKNMELYGQSTPPEYNISNIQGPLYLMYSKGDGTANWQDVEEFAAALNPGVVKGLFRPEEEYSHIDYLIAKDAVEVVYNQLMKYAEEIRNS